MVKVTYLIIGFLFFFKGMVSAQEKGNISVGELFSKQLSYYPQEKIYIQTDRNIYMSGETIWFRVHLVDAVFLKQANASRYVYLELITPTDKVIERMKLRPDSTGCFYGSIQLDEDLVEGNYSLRAYTRFMQNQGEEYFFRESIYVADPVSEMLESDIEFFEYKDKMNFKLSFKDKTNGNTIVPAQCLIFPDGDIEKKGIPLTFTNEVAEYAFKSEPKKSNQCFIIQTVIDNKIYNRYFRIPVLDKSFDVSFFPEGGHAPIAADVMVAFKAINANGLSEDVKGRVFDDLGHEYVTFESSHLGMGRFRMFFAPERKYYAICTNSQNISRRFELPIATENVVSLKTSWSNNYLRVSLSKSEGYHLPPQTELVAHIRGVVIYEEPWEEGRSFISFERDFFPAGIVHFLLVDKERNILSERLVFSSQESTFAKTEVIADSENYSPRSKVNLTVKLSDVGQTPLSGSCSVAVIDKKDVALDTLSNIVSTLLLSSELKGHIESPMSYLKGTKKSELDLDVLMMTQGWRKYNIPDVLKGKLTKDLAYPVELSDEVSGKVEGVFTALKKGGISLIALKDSVLGTSFTKPDNHGRFVFKDLDYPEGTRYIIQALTEKGSKRVFLEIDSLKPFPPLTITALNTKEKPQVNDAYITKMNEKYTIENGMRVYNLAEVVVTAKRKVVMKTESPYYSINSSKVLTAEDIEKEKILSVFNLLRRLPGITIIGNEVKYHGSTPLVLLDNIPEEEFDYERVNVEDIKDVFFAPPISVMPVFGGRAGGGAIVINTKKGFVEKNRLNSNMNVMKPMGYQQTVEFYSPVYETAQQKNSMNRDLRTTIYWNPNVQVDPSGTANISFYAADLPTRYGIVIEGISSMGHLIFSNQKEVTVNVSN